MAYTLTMVPPSPKITTNHKQQVIPCQSNATDGIPWWPKFPNSSFASTNLWIQIQYGNAAITHICVSLCYVTMSKLNWLLASCSVHNKHFVSHLYHLGWRRCSDGWGCELHSAGCLAGSLSCSAVRALSVRPSGSTAGTQTSADPRSDSPGEASAQPTVLIKIMFT